MYLVLYSDDDELRMPLTTLLVKFEELEEEKKKHFCLALELRSGISYNSNENLITDIKVCIFNMTCEAYAEHDRNEARSKAEELCNALEDTHQFLAKIDMEIISKVYNWLLDCGYINIINTFNSYTRNNYSESEFTILAIKLWDYLNKKQ